MISIITACLNWADMIETAIKSVIDQHYHHFEHAIVDGGFTDGMLDIIKNCKHLHVILDTDNDVYDAINKSIRFTKGDVIGLLNSDDSYESNSF